MNRAQEKQASLGLALGGALAGTVGGHVLTNLFLRHKLKDPRFLADVFRAGYRHGTAGRQVSPLRSGLFRRLAGPEIPEMYNYARYAGAIDRVRQAAPGVAERMLALPPEQHESFLKGLERKIRRRPEIRDLSKMIGVRGATSFSGAIPNLTQQFGQMTAPTEEQIGRLGGAIQRVAEKPPLVAKAIRTAMIREKLKRPLRLTGSFFAGERPAFMQRLGFGPSATMPAQPEPHGPLSMVKRVLPEAIAGVGLGALSAGGALPAVAAHIVPEVAGHVGVNLGRDLLARSGVGKKIFGRMLSRARSGKLPPRLLTDIALSPGVSEFLQTSHALGQLERAAAPMLPTQPPAPRPAPTLVPSPRPGTIVRGRYIPRSPHLRKLIGLPEA